MFFASGKSQAVAAHLSLSGKCGAITCGDEKALPACHVMTGRHDL